MTALAAAPSLADRLRRPYSGLPSAFWVLWTCTLINRLGDFVVPFLAFYLTDVQHIPVAKVGLVLSLFGVGSIAAGPVGGFLTDRLGRKRTMMGAMTLSAATMVALGFSHGLVAMAGLILLLGLFSQASRPAISATIADVVPAEDRVRAFGLHYWVVNIAFAFASVVGGWLAHRAFTTLFLVDALTTMVAVVLIGWKIPETRPAGSAAQAESTGDVVAAHRDRLYLGFVFLTFLTGLVVVQFNATALLDMRAHGISTATFGQLAAINGVMIVLLQPVISPRLARVARQPVQAVAALLMGVGIAMTGAVGTAAGYALTIAVWTLGEMIGSGVTSAIVADFAPPSHRGRYQGLVHMAWGAAICVGPFAGTQVMARWGASTLWAACLALGILTAIGHLAMTGPMRRRFHDVGASMSA